jgi:hypothetical protein
MVRVALPVIPAKAGISGREDTAANLDEIPAFAGMTSKEVAP